MITAKVDNKRRVVLPSAKPGQVFCLEAGSDGSYKLTPVLKADTLAPVITTKKKRTVKPVNRNGLLVLPLEAEALDAEALDCEIREERESENARLLG